MAVGEESSDKMKKPPFNRFSVAKALARAGLESSNLIVGIDFTKSNGWTGTTSYNRSLHHIGDSLNPYEQAISIIGKTLAAFDEDNLTPFYGFEDAHDQEVFSFFPDERICNGFEEVLSHCREIVPHLRLAGPDQHILPVIEMAMTIVEQNGCQYKVLVILADGQSKIFLRDVGDGAAMKLVVNVIMERFCRLCVCACVVTSSFTGRHWCTYVFDERPFNGPILISYRISPGTSTKGLVACSGIRRICFPACPISAPANELYKVAKSRCISDEDFPVVTDGLSKIAKPIKGVKLVLLVALG